MAAPYRACAGSARRPLPQSGFATSCLMSRPPLLFKEGKIQSSPLPKSEIVGDVTEVSFTAHNSATILHQHGRRRTSNEQLQNKRCVHSLPIKSELVGFSRRGLQKVAGAAYSYIDRSWGNRAA